MGTFIRHKITRVVVFVFLSIVFSLNGMYVFAQTDSTAIQNNSKVAFFGVPLGDFSAGTIFSLVVFAVILALITIVIFGFFVLYSVLSSYKRVPRERALVFAWNTLRKYRAHFIGMTVFVVLFSNLHLVLLYFFTHFAPFSWRYPLENFHFFSTPYSGEQFVFSLIGFILGTYIFAGVIRVVLRCSDGAKPNFHHLFVSLRRFIPFLLGTFFYYGISIVGLLFFIFPGMYFASAFYFWQYRYIDGGVTLVASFRDSLAMTRGARKEVFLFWYLTQVIIVTGTFVLGVGYLLSFPLALLALSCAYGYLKKEQYAQ